MSILARKLFARGGINLNPGSIHMKDPESGQGGGSAGGQEGGEGGDAGNQASGSEGGDDGADNTGDDNEGGNGDDGDKKPSEAEAKLLKELMSWKQKAKDTASTLDQLTAEQKALRETLGDMKPEDIKQLVEAKKSAEIKELEDKKQYDRIVERMRQENETVTSGLKSQIEELQQQLSSRDKAIEDLTIGRAFSDSEFIRKNSTLPPSIARKEFDGHFETKQDGTVVAYDKPAGAPDRTMIVDASGNPKAFNDAIKELFEKHPDSASILRATAKPGIAGQDTTTKVTVKKGEEKPVRGLAKIQAGLSESKS